MPPMRLAETMADTSDAVGFAATHGSAGARMAFDWLALGLIIGVLSTVLPPIAAGLAIVYHIIRLWETNTVLGWRRRLRIWWRRR
jgi:hypothetical protein